MPTGKRTPMRKSMTTGSLYSTYIHTYDSYELPDVSRGSRSCRISRFAGLAVGRFVIASLGSGMCVLDWRVGSLEVVVGRRKFGRGGGG